MSVNKESFLPEPNFLTSPKGLKSWLLTLDHKRIGLMYLFAIMFFFMIGGIFAVLIRLELLQIGETIMSADTYNRMFTLHGAIMIFLFIIPAIPAAMGNIMLPIMLGAKDVAFPRLNLASWYIYIGGSLFAIYSMAHGAVDTGWTFYTPYSTSTNGAVISMTLGVFIIGFSSILTGLNFIVTIHKLRLPGMTWFKMPLFIWGLYATAIIQVLATPVLAITLILLILERTLGIGIFDPAMGGDPVLFQHFFWFYSHPAVYIMILPGMGIISEMVAVFSHKRIFGYKAIAFSSLGIAFLSFLVWGHHMFTSGQSEYAAMIFSFLTFMVGIPSGIKTFNWLATLFRGSITFEAPMLYVFAFLFLFTIGGLTGIFLGALPVDIHLHDTYFVVAHFHYVMMGGTVMAFLGGIHYWWPKIWGRMYSEAWARVAWVLIFVGFNMTFFTQFLLGTKGMPRRYFDYLPQFEGMHGFSSVGSLVLGAGFIVMAFYLIHAIFKGRLAGDNPWGALTLEWQTSSPPPPENFLKDPVFTHGPYDYDTVDVQRTV
ncbi:MAG TPA: cytochrome c oxidase subunit I [Candidatus Marinimicrobia bacterium]|nr:MAG: cytochrome c oxidase subunit I [Candidatus Marinimicrobia bacterium CG1_02_48_14]PJA55084.1 MAG: cytochrome c oxidase subunit I [Candidatus Marinimicrobia bacterium CG_4_9_14_3_um_filter_48_9]HCW76409.1 cytochrome c oxidase subunit I [Candidatus Neomarinimicrobiota bacterium]